jgi:hypothetical protein
MEEVNAGSRIGTFRFGACQNCIRKDKCGIPDSIIKQDTFSGWLRLSKGEIYCLAFERKVKAGGANRSI